MEGPAILATAVPGTGQHWFPQRVEVVGHQIVEGSANRKGVGATALGGAVGGGIVGGPVGALAGAVAGSIVAKTSTHIEYTLQVTVSAAAPVASSCEASDAAAQIQGMQLVRQTRWSKVEALVARMKERARQHPVPESAQMEALAATLPTKFKTLDPTSSGASERIGKRMTQLGEFLAGVLSLWQLIRQMAAGGDVGYLCTEKIFQDFFELGPGDGAPAGAGSDPASPFSTAPAVGTDFGDWRVSGGVLLVQALPVPDGQ